MHIYLRRGFTLIELLTVIAIIAVLAALLFPVLNRVKEGTNQTTCMSNLHRLYVAASAYRDDNGGEYPCLLLGVAERADGLPWLPTDSTPPVPAGKIQRNYLLSAYLKNDISALHCPDNPDREQTRATTAIYPPSSPWATTLGGPPTFDNGGCADCLKDLVAAHPEYKGQPISFYAFDSYDLSSALGMDGKRVGEGYQIVYSKDWTGGSGASDAPNQLKYPSAPTDKTILAWCNYHVSTARAEKCPVIFASGTSKPLDYKQMVEKGWNIGR